MANDPAEGAARAGVQSVEIGMRVLMQFLAANGPLALRDVARGAELGSSAAHRYLVSLVRSGFLCQRGDHRYDLGPLATSLGFAAIARMDFVDVSSDRLRSFVDQTGVTAMLSVWAEAGPIVVRWLRGREQVFTSIGVGTVMPVEGSATGRVFLAWGDGPILSARRQNRSLAAMVQTMLQAGYAEISGDFIPGLQAVAAPVFDGSERLVAVMTAVRAGAGIPEPVRTELCAAAAEASEALGFRKGTGGSKR